MQPCKVNPNRDKGLETYLSGGHALRGATLQQHLLLEPHLPPQWLLLEVLPQVYRREVTQMQSALTEGWPRHSGDTLFILVSLVVMRTHTNSDTHSHTYHTHQAKLQNSAVRV